MAQARVERALTLFSYRLMMECGCTPRFWALLLVEPVQLHLDSCMYEPLATIE
jgi:hypothetical protein